MDFSPPPEQLVPLFGHDFHSATDIAPLHPIGPNQFRTATGSSQIYLDLPVAKHVYMRGLLIGPQR